MPKEERIEVLKHLRTSFPKDGIELSSPEWHRPLVVERLDIADSPDARWLSIDELRAALMKR